MHLYGLTTPCLLVGQNNTGLGYSGSPLPDAKVGITIFPYLARPMTSVIVLSCKKFPFQTHKLIQLIQKTKLISYNFYLKSMKPLENIIRELSE